MKRPSVKRSGVKTRRVQTTTYDSFPDSIEIYNQSTRKEVSFVDGYIEEAEKLAFDIYARNGLPHCHHVFFRARTGEWLPVSEIDDKLDKFSALTLVQNFGKDFPADSIVGFATGILERAMSLKIAIDKASDSERRVAALAIALCQELNDYTLEFTYARPLGMGMKAYQAPSRGGKARAAALARATRANRARWQERAAEIFAAHPGHSISAAARIIALETGAALNTIRKHIVKT